MSTGPDKAARLVQELTERVGLDPVDAHRSAFLAFACARGWPKARVGRYLGITRQRVEQKLDKLEHYAASTTNVPTLKAVMRRCEQAQTVRAKTDGLVRYAFDDWSDSEFARRLVEHVAA